MQAISSRHEPMRRYCGRWLALVSAVLTALHSHAAVVTADALVSRSAVYVGETFPFQIQITGSDQPDPPDLSAITDFVVQPCGGQTFRNESFNMVNGRTTRAARHGYTFNYQLTPKRAGRLSIPSIPVNAEGRQIQTRPLTLTASPPTERDDFKLRLGLSKTSAYLGEPIILDVVWYLGREAQGGRFTLPVSDGFDVSDAYVDHPRSGRFVDVQVDNRVMRAEEGQATLGDKSYTTLRFEKILVPKREGEIAIEPGTVAFTMPSADSSLTGSRPAFSGRSFGPSFMGIPGFASSRQVIIPSNPLRLVVQPLPGDGRPSGFAGPVGHLQISASAHPTAVNVGDPITLTITLTGSKGLDHVNLPSLSSAPAFTNDFKVRSDVAAGQRTGAARTFSQTIRPLRAEVKEIPSLELPYFDPTSGSYQVARSKPIPVKVRWAKLVTAADGEGWVRPGATNDPEPAKMNSAVQPKDYWKAIQSRLAGLAVWLGSPLGLFLMALLPAAYLASRLALFLRRRRNANRQAIRARRAYRRLNRTLSKLALEDSSQTVEAVLSALRVYLGDRLGLNAAALTFSDVKEPLARQGVAEETMAALRDMFQACEVSRFGEASDPPEVTVLIGQCQQLAGEIEAALPG